LDEVVGLESGADDYIASLSTWTCCLRVKAVLRAMLAVHPENPPSPPVTWKSTRAHTAPFTAAVDISCAGFRLYALASQAGKVVGARPNQV
jgi:hypothetical protein